MVIDRSRASEEGQINASFGFVIRGSNPARVEQLEEGGAADNAGLKIGDAILKINGIDVRQASHTHLIKLLQVYLRVRNC